MAEREVFRLKKKANVMVVLGWGMVLFFGLCGFWVLPDEPIMALPMLAAAGFFGYMLVKGMKENKNPVVIEDDGIIITGKKIKWEDIVETEDRQSEVKSKFGYKIKFRQLEIWYIEPFSDVQKRYLSDNYEGYDYIRETILQRTANNTSPDSPK